MVRTLSSTELPEAQKEVKSWVPNKSGKACWIFRDQWDTENNWHKTSKWTSWFANIHFKLIGFRSRDNVHESLLKHVPRFAQQCLLVFVCLTQSAFFQRTFLRIIKVNHLAHCMNTHLFVLNQNRHGVSVIHAC